MGEGAERIVRRIFADAEEKAKAIKDEAARKAASIESAAQQKAEQKRDQILEQARKEAEEQKRRIIGVAQLEARKDLLSAKQDMIGEAFQQSLEQLAGMDDQAYLAVIRKMLLQVVENGTETVAFSARDLKRVTENFMQEVNTTLAESGKKGELKVASEPREIKGGFILVTDGAEVNCSFNALLEMKRDDLEPEAAALLFK